MENAELSPLGPMSPEELLARAQELVGQAVELVTTPRGETIDGTCQGIGSLAIRDGHITGSLELHSEAPKKTEKWPGQRIHDIKPKAA